MKPDPIDPWTRAWIGGARTLDAFHQILGISPALRAKGLFQVDAVRWFPGKLRIDLSGTGFGRVVLQLHDATPGLRVCVQGPVDNLHPHVIKLLAHLESRLGSITLVRLLHVLREDPDSKEDKPEAPPVPLSVKHPMRSENADPKPYAHRWEGGPTETGPWGLFFDDLVFVFSPFTAVNFIVPTVHIFHGHHECLCVTPKIPTRLTFPFNYPVRKSTPVGDRVRARLGLPSLKKAQSFKRLSTDMTELDTIFGATDKLQRAVEFAMTGPKEKIISLHNSCLPEVMGEDVELPLAQARCAKHVHCLSKGMGLTHTSSLFAEELEFGLEECQVMRDLLLTTDPPKVQEQRDGNCFDLVGFPDGRDTNELVSLLEESGAILNAAILPNIDVEVGRKTPRPNLQVRYPNPYYDEIYEHVFDDLAPVWITPPAPFGLAATERWVREIAEVLHLDTSTVEATLAATRDSIRPRWERLQSLASGLRLAFVVDERVLPRLIDPARSFGLPLLAILAEMHFNVDVLCYALNGDISYTDRDRIGDGVRRFVFRDPKELQDLLSVPEIHAVYSDRMYDRRLSRTGKSQFGFSDFEFGFQGALRSFERLIGTCSLPFYRRYARHFPSGNP